MAGEARLQIVIDAINQAGDELKALQKDLGGVGDSAKKASDAHESTFSRMKAGYMDVRSFAMDAVQGLQKIWDFAKEGAQIELQRNRFDRLAQSIGTTADALQGKLAAATKGMLSSSEQVQMGTDLMSLGLAKTEDQVVRLSRASAGLGMDMNQLVLTLANQTTMRFDQLGVSIDGFDKRLADLKASGMDANAAFTEAFLQQADCHLANRTAGFTFPTQRTAFDVPVKHLSRVFEPNYLLSVFVKKISKGGGPGLQSSSQGQEAEGHVR